MAYTRKITGIVISILLGLSMNTLDVSAETSENQITDQNNLEFIETIGTNAQSIAIEHGLYPSVMVAQAILESDFGRSELALAPSNNLFGIKGSFNGNSVVMSTNEFYDDEFVTVNEQFRSYPGYYSSLLNNARVLRNGNAWDSQYYRGTWVENTNSYRDATAWLDNRYATDPNYGSKLNDIIQRYQLTRFDSNVQTASIERQSTPKEVSPKPIPTPSTNHSTHLVVAGDTLYNIANRYGLTVSELQNLNQLSTHSIQIGQTLTIKKSGENDKKHVVEQGDTLYNISVRYGLKVDDLREKNGLSSNIIFIGQELIL